MFVLLSYVQRDFSTALSKKDLEGFHKATWKFVMMVFVATPLFAVYEYMQVRTSCFLSMTSVSPTFLSKKGIFFLLLNPVNIDIVSILLMPSMSNRQMCTHYIFLNLHVCTHVKQVCVLCTFLKKNNIPY